MLAWNDYCGFSLLCYLQRECNYRFLEHGTHHKFIRNPPGFKIKGPKVIGFVDFSMLPNVYPWEKRSEWEKVAETQMLVEDEDKDEADILGGSEEIESRRLEEWEWYESYRENEIYCGPDIFLKDGEMVDYFGRRRKLFGIEKFSVPLTLFNGVLSNEEIRIIGDSVFLADKVCWSGGRHGAGAFGLRGKLVEAMWNVSQFQPSSCRGELYMLGASSRPGEIVAGSSCGGIKLDSVRRNKVGATFVRAEWCVELYRLFFETISLRFKNRDFESS